MDQQIDKQRYRASIASLEAIFQGINATANRVATWRCPYKNAQDRCTAGFGCRNQLRGSGPEELSVCTGSDDLDYREAWQV